MKLEFRPNRPGICVPLTGPGLSEIFEEIKACAGLPVDVLEWRADYYTGDILQALPQIKEKAGNLPLLCTVRTKQEGGVATLSTQEYENLVGQVIDNMACDGVDIEWSCGAQRVERLSVEARERSIATIISKHDFEKTPPEQELLSVLLEMKQVGGGVPKYAVTPKSPADVIALLSATEKAFQAIGPVITMSMGNLGKMTRAAGGIVGSCLTFGSVKNTSAPGQIKVELLARMLREFGLRE